MRVLLPLVLAGCPICPDDYPIEANITRQTALDPAFRADPRWLGGDGAYAIDLGGDRTLWLFGDSFIATTDAHVRTESTMVRNSVAVMTGRDLGTATFSFAWRENESGPASFFPETGDHWFWPSDGVRMPDGPLVVFLSELQPGPGLGFAGAGFRAVRVADPSGPPLTWTWLDAGAHAPPFAPGSNVACTAVDGDHLIAVVSDGDSHDGYLARWPLDAADLATPAWWTGSEWVAETALAQRPAVVIPDGATECSLHADPVVGWVYLWSRGFGATTIAARNAPAPTGPWSDAKDLFTPPESKVDHAFVYAAKAHPFLPGPSGNGMLVTFADNSFTFADLFAPSTTLYWPHVVELIFLMVLC